jgi:23S rRNA pseudouridine2605 synthase
MTNSAESRLLMLHKPKGYVVTRSDEKNRKTVYELLPPWAYDDGWMPVGRLDMDSKGLLLFTRNGHISDYLTEPGSCHKLYEVWVRGHVTPDQAAQMVEGVETTEGLLRAVRVEIKGGAGPKTRLEVELDEGKNRHIRRMFGELKDPKFGTPLKVLELKRIAVGLIHLDVDSGKWRFLTQDEERNLLDA